MNPMRSEKLAIPSTMPEEEFAISAEFNRFAEILPNFPADARRPKILERRFDSKLSAVIQSNAFQPAQENALYKKVIPIIMESSESVDINSKFIVNKAQMRAENPAREKESKRRLRLPILSKR
jgi:hypothetical protein